MAVTHADRILYWQEELPEEEIPPVWMWPFVPELEAWFDRVRSDRANRHKSGGARDNPELVENELAADWRR